MSASSACSSLTRHITAATSSSNNAAIPAASHHLPPTLNGYSFSKHVRSSLSHDTFIGQAERREEEGTPATSQKVIRIYALDYLRRDEECRFTIERECMAGRIVPSHPHLLTVEKVFASQTDLFLVEPYCSGGDLYEYMVSIATAAAAAAAEHADVSVEDSIAGKGLSIEFAQRLARELLTAVHFLHTTCGLVHRNIKLETLFCDARMSLHLGGFGLCAVLPTSLAGGENVNDTNTTNNDGNASQGAQEEKQQDVAVSAAASASTSLMRLCCSSKHYAAPELIQGQPYQGEAVDAWACGVVLFALLTGCFPFDSLENDDEALFKLICGDAETHLAQHPALAAVEDPRAVDLVRNLLRQSPKSRYSVAEALEHPFLV
ncbi:serine/threonine-protein kinase-like protein [Leptomonas pyrrhocoris]|uniref:non-specific serine/threonine protein kinase n=1 Tax=Leptomonas pyrrhocoris TaxID=157538 RepID=A0A0N0VED9_LEPPY|nr:serine/threonine-protein kinase-like protein [Leptomonas pyrrhocoris]XP_015656560.1 serine/threonine-protein kinase-like protein [Leptomonas pyrrhocoris]KPA78120.1 serine/threonine-protein kinase-like protein [Leptomonas pyrrhocoris]KPA78121.1 serine/threonine-protein kinase-like protein [Leptomonas pyrrhocoris]|eukprot:XP_015656559.1 serine/threonine-protein kinase-like protein [Leptomonas pyrrhocoris]